MPQDPYGFRTDAPPDRGSPAAPLMATFTVLLSVFVCLGCGSFGVFVGMDAAEPRVADKVGVGMLASVCAWPAAGTALWSLLLLIGYRRPWLQAGPNLLLGTITGLVAWTMVCLGVIGYTVATDP